MAKKSVSQSAWARHVSKGGGGYFVYDLTRPHTMKLVETGKYGVVQLICITNTARKAFMAGYRAGRRSASNGDEA